MNRLKKVWMGFFMVAISINSFGQDSTKTEKIKTGWNFGAIPVISYNSDLGLQYGALTNIYNYGDGKAYPMYYHSFYAEVSRFTKGSGIYRIFYDSKYLIPNIRFTADFSYLPDQAFDFYGFNGSQAVYNKDWKDDESDDYKTRMFYKHKKNMLRTRFDFQGKTGINHLNWAAGILFNNVEIATVDIDKLNKGKEGNDTLPHVPTLFDQYVDWKIIKENEKTGGFFTSVKAGLVYDTRDNEPNPMKGIWSEAVLSQTLNNDFKYTKLSVTHRQYFTLVKNNLSFVYRIGYQGIIAGDAPFYNLPEMVFSYTPSASVDGLGGSKSVRGMVRNRVIGNGIVYGNLEFRWKFVKFNWINQNFYLALSPFVDFGKVVQEKEVDKSGIPVTVLQSEYFNEGKDEFHITYGSGFRIAMNQNFIIAVDAGFPANKDDGDMGLYIGLNFLF
ncbi:MAG TPA: hypothetical protein DCQ26_07325 [Marinilabiliales bacterium]|nr:MAG: hypothetical protein A2W84_19275 [Bacteroidetes bacterium GWC2_40_13]OFX71843.1 MAG: hypothetical protein A2W96_06330 [Bacteroidetes bacterium GWD2_40_43]OFX94641.1 MAG: hypothetical protein A2W97_18135 [Bacteroidetes bacterium GWE2_40_63]OFY17942.1 MAG: hypothetical protein A2W88_16270 [Bacteroidetes bacterium GWF2_40_13]HAM98407.1 hypothetical protein [Marinilabiliales bacterium]